MTPEEHTTDTPHCDDCDRPIAAEDTCMCEQCLCSQYGYGHTFTRNDKQSVLERAIMYGNKSGGRGIVIFRPLIAEIARLQHALNDVSHELCEAQEYIKKNPPCAGSEYPYVPPPSQTVFPGGVEGSREATFGQTREDSAT